MGESSPDEREWEVPPCTSCGVCCFSDDPKYLRVANVDRDRLGPLAEQLTTQIGDDTFLRLVDGHCCALVYDPAKHEFLCSVYESRPDVCRWLARGSGVCASDRQEKADRTLVLLRRSAAR